MDLKQAVELLENYNKWRRGAEIPQPNPTEIGVAISLVLERVKATEGETEFEQFTIDFIQNNEMDLVALEDETELTD